MSEAEKLCDRLVLLHQGAIVESGSPQEILRKHTPYKEVSFIYQDGNQETRPLEQASFEGIDYERVDFIHTLEPTLEDVFIQLTGVKLNDERN